MAQGNQVVSCLTDIDPNPSNDVDESQYDLPTL